MASPKRKAKPEPKAARDDARPQKAAAKDHADLIARARKDYDRAEQRDRDNRLAAYDDLAFLTGGEAQWDKQALQDRAENNRPALTMNRLPQFVEQVTGDQRQMRPAIRCTPVDDRGDDEVAEILSGLFRYIENRSNASEAIYPAGGDSQAACGIGHWQVTTEYADDATFEQEIRISGVDDQVAVRWDPDASCPVRSDARFCHVPVDMSRGAFEETYPDVTASSWETSDGLNFSDWLSDDHVRLARYWYKKPVAKTLALTTDGQVIDLTDGDPEKLAAAGAGARIEKRTGHEIWHCLMTATDVVEEPRKWPGPHIPVVPVIGREIRIGRKVVRSGIVRHAKDPQRLHNFAKSAEVETIAQQPVAPWLVTDEQVKDFEEEWSQANKPGQPYLRHRHMPGQPLPQRTQPPVTSPGFAQLAQSSADEMHAVTGIYPASLGAQSNETSGKAILARQREGDTGTFVFIKNYGLSVKRTAEIIIGLIPHIYDTAREIRVVGEDGKVDRVKVNQPAGLALAPDDEGAEDQAAAERIHNDLTVGAYDVVCEMGASYATKKAEARDGMLAFVQAMPETGQLIADLFAKAQDWPLADKIAKRLMLGLPPQIQQAEAEESGEPPNPAQQQAMMQQQMQQQAQMQAQQQAAQQQQQLEAAKLQLEHVKLQVETMKIQAEGDKARLDLQGKALDAAKPQPGAEQPPAAGPDETVQALAQHVAMLTQAVQEIDAVLEKVVTSLSGPPPQGPPPGAAPMMPDAPQPAPPAGFSLPEGSPAP